MIVCCVSGGWVYRGGAKMDLEDTNADCRNP